MLVLLTEKTKKENLIKNNKNENTTHLFQSV